MKKQKIGQGEREKGRERSGERERRTVSKIHLFKGNVLYRIQIEKSC